MSKHALQAGFVSALLAGGSLFAMAGAANADPTTSTTTTLSPTTSTTTKSTSAKSTSFLNQQKLLEQRLAIRASQLTHLSADITTAAKTLTPAHLLVLNTNVATATTNINALIAKVPTDTTNAELKTDRSSMLKQNRVFAVLTPQVYLTIEADSVTARVTTFEGNEPSLQAEVTSLVGEPGYKTASNHYQAFVKSVNSAAAEANDVATDVLAQTPSNYPGDTHVFVSANHKLLDANIALAHASYDESVIGLAAGGYAGA